MKLLVLYDDISLEIGRLRIREKGSAGGHNGIKSIIANLCTDIFPRIKIGVGQPKGDLVSHVLGKFNKEEKEVLKESMEASALAVEIILKEDTKEAMNKFNGFKATTSIGEDGVILMRLKGLLKPLESSDKFKEIIKDIKSNKYPINIYGLSESGKSYILDGIYENLETPLVIVTHSDMEAKNLYEDLSFYTTNVYYFPTKEVVFYNIDAISGDLKMGKIKSNKRNVR